MSRKMSKEVSKEMSPAAEELGEYLEEVFEKLDNELTKIEEIAMSKFLTREDVLKKRPVRFEDVEIPEWGGTIRIIELKSSVRDNWEQSNLEDKGKGKMKLRMENARARLVALTAIDPESGDLLFTENDVRAIGEQSAAAVDRIYEVASRLSRISEGDLEELTKN